VIRCLLGDDGRLVRLTKYWGWGRDGITLPPAAAQYLLLSEISCRSVPRILDIWWTTPPWRTAVARRAAGARDLSGLPRPEYGPGDKPGSRSCGIPSTSFPPPAVPFL